ncbi:MAG: iron-containing alcohol dehydrogenase [Treponema sp.]|nr:iron-containing alcohol dehydrogenase [Treponema sp.]
MNILKKIYCRTFQAAFKLALPILPYTTPKILNKVEDLPEEFLKRKISKIMLVTDSGLRAITAKLEELLPEKGIDCIVYDGTEANPKVSNVEEALKIYKSEDCQALIAFGGGSSMDLAKALGARVVYPKRSLNQMKGILKVRRRLPLLAAIPTTAGTGSEVTLASVITDDKTHYKYAINSFPLIPKIAVLDPKVTFTLPKSLTASTGMDALTHAVEAYIGGSTTRQTRKWAKDAVTLIFQNILTAYNEPENAKARENMLIASNYAGSAFSQSYVGYVHAVAHSLGGAYNVPHGLANSVLLPIVLKEYGKACWKKLSQLAILVGLADKNQSQESAANKFIDAIKDLNKKLGIPETLKGIKEEDIPELSRRADKEANPLYPVPVLWDAKELKKFYYMVMEK